MWRIIGAVIVGYLAMFAFIFVSFSIAYLIMGTEGAFESGSFDVSSVWIFASFVLGFVAAIIGGMVCAAIADHPKAPLALAGFVLILGLLMAIPVLTAPEADPAAARDASVSTFDAMSQAKQPGWVALANPFLGVIGVLIGGSLRRGSGNSAAS